MQSNFVLNMSDKQLYNLCSEIGFKTYKNTDYSGTNISRNDESILISAWNNNLANDGYHEIELYKYDLKSEERELYLSKYFKHMIDRFGYSWSKKAINYYDRKKQPQNAMLIKKLLKEHDNEQAFIHELDYDDMQKIFRLADFKTFSIGPGKETYINRGKNSIKVTSWWSGMGTGVCYDGRLIVKDFDISKFIQGKKVVNDKFLQDYFTLMIEKFGDDWTNSAIKHFKKKNAVTKLFLVKKLSEEIKRKKLEEVNQAKISTQPIK